MEPSSSCQGTVQRLTSLVFHRYTSALKLHENLQREKHVRQAIVKLALIRTNILECRSQCRSVHLVLDLGGGTWLTPRAECHMQSELTATITSRHVIGSLLSLIRSEPSCNPPHPSPSCNPPHRTQTSDLRPKLTIFSAPTPLPSRSFCRKVDVSSSARLQCLVCTRPNTPSLFNLSSSLLFSVSRPLLHHSSFNTRHKLESRTTHACRDINIS